MALKFNVEDFNLQAYLGDMRNEARNGISNLSEKVEHGFNNIHTRATDITSKLVKHELDESNKFLILSNRLDVLETLHNEWKWFKRTLIAAIIGAGVAALIRFY